MKKLGLLALVFVVSGCQSKSPPSAEPNAASWPTGMQKMSDQVLGLIPYVYSRRAFAASENKQNVGERLKRFAASVHGISAKDGEKLVGDDPILKFSLSRLKSDVDAAFESFREGQFEYSRDLVKKSLGHCFHCHTSTQMGPEFDFTSKVNLGSLEPLDRTDLFVATRQFEKAADTLKEVLADVSADAYTQDRAVKKYLALMVRVKQDPVTAGATLDTFLERAKVPFYLADEVQHWRAALRSWAKERRQKPMSLSETKKLIAKAEGKQEYLAHQIADVEYLRATAQLHALLRTTRDAATKAEIYLLLGHCYEVLTDLGFWELPEVYYEACVHERPNTDLARQCYKKFEKNILLGFSGSAGTFIPAVEKERLQSLKQLAGIK